MNIVVGDKVGKHRHIQDIVETAEQAVVDSFGCVGVAIPDNLTLAIQRGSPYHLGGYSSADSTLITNIPRKIKQPVDNFLSSVLVVTAHESMHAIRDASGVMLQDSAASIAIEEGFAVQFEKYFLQTKNLPFIPEVHKDRKGHTLAMTAQEAAEKVVVEYPEIPVGPFVSRIYHLHYVGYTALSLLFPENEAVNPDSFLLSQSEVRKLLSEKL